MNNKLMNTYLQYYGAWRKAKFYKKVSVIGFICSIGMFISAYVHHDRPLQGLTLIAATVNTISYYVTNRDAHNIFNSMLIVEDQIIGGGDNDI